MPTYRKRAEYVQAHPYQTGMEDGFAVAPGLMVRPYLNNKYGRQFILEGDMIVTDATGHREAMSPKMFDMLYHKDDDHEASA